MKITQDERNEMFADLDKYFAVPDLQPGDFSIMDLTERYSISRSSARDRVRQMQDDGIVETVGRVSGRIYYRVAHPVSDNSSSTPALSEVEVCPNDESWSKDG